MNNEIRKYLSSIGRRGGRKSRRSLDPEMARNMVRVREARKAYRIFHSRCFWSFDPDYKITFEDIPWVVEQLMKNGGRDSWDLANRLCH